MPGACIHGDCGRLAGHGQGIRHALNSVKMASPWMAALANLAMAVFGRLASLSGLICASGTDAQQGQRPEPLARLLHVPGVETAACLASRPSRAQRDAA